MQENWIVKYFNNWKGHPYKIIRVLNDVLKNQVCNVWWDIDDCPINEDTVGVWKPKGTPSLLN